MVTAFSAECLRLSDHFERGVMLVAGGLFDQPNRYIRAFEIIRARRAHNAKQEPPPDGA
jgi:hypothetical protein